MRIKLIVGAVLLLASQHSFGQVSPAGHEQSFPLKVGLGFSNFDSDWNGRISGPSLWLDWNLHQAPSFMNGLGLEIEARDLHYGSPLSQLRFDTLSGGAIYSFRARQNIRPYVQFLVGLGSVDFPRTQSGYSHDTRTITEPGGGIDWQIASRLKLRAGYEYQFWPDLFHGHALNPSGFTIGTAYDFGERHSRIY
jgi:opacity protein-like surface antigen